MAKCKKQDKVIITGFSTLSTGDVEHTASKDKELIYDSFLGIFNKL